MEVNLSVDKPFSLTLSLTWVIFSVTFIDLVFSFRSLVVLPWQYFLFQENTW